MKNKIKNVTRLMVLLVALFVAIPLVWIALLRWEGEPPVIEAELPTFAIGKSHKLSLIAADKKSGLRKVWVGLLKDGKEQVLVDKEYPSSGFLGKGAVNNDVIHVPLDTQVLGIGDGKAVLRMMVRDYSWRNLWHGNKYYAEKEVMIDTRPPGIDVLTRVHNIAPGGAGLVIYQLSETCARSGVKVGDIFFPGHTGLFEDATIMTAFFALNHDQGRETVMAVEAIDHAGNQAETGFPFYIRKRNFRKDTLTISDGFLNSMLPKMQKYLPTDLAQTKPVDKFLYINSVLRRENYETIVAVGERSANRMMWAGAFQRLPNAARRAAFADRRSYQYGSETIDKQVHLGIDLASTTHAMVPAANSGRVIFTGEIGIYGKTIVIDHGFGLMSTYSHLNRIDVAEKQEVTIGDAIGLTGTTGLAGGDHLHFGMLIHNTFVTPVEWWDGSWIKHNITRKIEGIRGMENSSG